VTFFECGRGCTGSSGAPCEVAKGGEDEEDGKVRYGFG
jgi:hypothetical protein